MGRTMPQSRVTSQCYVGGDAGYHLLYDIVVWIPLLRFIALYGRIGDRDTRLYFLVYYGTYLPASLLGLLLREAVIRARPDNPDCNSETYSLPSIETLLLAQYFVQGLLHHVHFRLPIGWLSALSEVVIWVLVIGLMWWSGQYGPRDLFAGVGFGIAFGLLSAYWVFDVWVPRFPFFAASDPWRKLLGNAEYNFLGPRSPDDYGKWAVL